MGSRCRWRSFQEPEAVWGVIFPIAVKKVFISVELKSKYFAASRGKVRWDDACVAEYLQKAVSNGNYWRFGGLVFYTLSILRNQKGLY